MPDNDNIPFDYMGAKQAGYSDQEIQGFLKDKYNFQFDITGAKNSGYSDKEIGDYITNYKAQPSTPAQQEPAQDVSSYSGFGSRAFEIPGLTRNDQIQRAKEAIPNINKAFSSKETTKALNQMQQDALDKSLAQIPTQQPNSETQPVPKPDIKVLPSITNETSEAFKDVTNPNSYQGRVALKSVLNTTKDENFKNNLAADLQAYDHQDKDPMISGALNKKIKSGQYGYDPVAQRPTIKMNPAQSFIDGIEKTYQAKQKAEFLNTASPDEIAVQAEKEREQAKNDYATPIAESAGWNIPIINISGSKIANTIGENITGFAKAGAASAAAVGTLGVAGIAAAPEFYAADAATPLLKPTLGALFIAHDAGMQAAGQTFDQKYNEQRDVGFDPQTATQNALHEAQFVGATTAAQMGLMGLAGLKLGEHPLPGTVWDKGLKQIIKSHVQNIAPFLKRLVPEAGVQGTIAGTIKGLQNLDAGKPVMDGTGESAMGAAAFVSLLSAVGGGLHALTPRGELVAMNGISKMNPDLVERGINQAVDQNHLTEQQAQEFRDKLNEQRSLNKNLPPDAPLENRGKIQALITKRNALENQLDPDHPSFVDKAFHPDIKEEINGVKKVKADGTSEGKDGINEKIRQLSVGESPNFHEDEKLTKTPLDQAKELIAAKAVDGKIGNYDASNPQELLKNIAEQAHGGTMLDGKFISSRPIAEEMFGKELVDLAAKAHPEHVISESKTEEVTQGKAIVPNSDKIAPTKELQTWDIGDMAGKPEDEAAKKHLEGVVRDWDTKPAGKQGETFGEFVNRVIPTFDKILKEEPKNATVITHSSVLKAFKVWDEMGRPDVENLTPEQKTEFANIYNKEETQNADLDTFKGANGDIHVIRHGQTEDNAKNNFRSGDTNLTEKGIQQAKDVGQQLKEKTGGDVPKIITSDLPRAIHTSNLITDELNNNKTKDNATLQQQGSDEMGLRDKTAVGRSMGERNAESKESANESGGSGGQPPTEEKGAPEEEENGSDVTGIKNAISEKYRINRSLPKINVSKLGADSEVLQRGKELVDSGKINPREVVAKINTTNEGMQPDEAAAMQYYMHQLAKEHDNLQTELAATDDPEQKAKINANLQQLSDETDAATYANEIAGTAWSHVGNIRQIVVDSGFNASREKSVIKNAYGGEMPEEVQKKLDAVTKERDEAIAALKKVESGIVKKSIKETAKDFATKLRKNAKLNRPGSFSAATPASLIWDSAVEIVAKSIEAGGALADAIAKGIEHIKASDWYKGISKEKQDQATNDFEKWHKSQSESYAEIEKLNKQANRVNDKTNPPILKTENGKLAGVSEPTDFTKKLPERKTFEKDSEWVKAKQRVANAEFKMRQMKRQAFESKKNMYQKGLMWAGRMIRLSVLSGYNVLAKLSSAATIGGALKRIPEQIIGTMYSGIFKGISEKAPIEGTPYISSEIKFYKDFFNPKKFITNAWEILKTGSSDLTKRFSNAEYEHVPGLYLPTDLHQIIKDPLKRGTFEAALNSGLKWAENNGLDVRDDLVIQSIQNAAYKRATYEIFQEQNSLSKWFNDKKAQLDKAGNTGATGKFLVDFMVPVSTVPTNIVRRVGATSPFGLIRGGAKVIGAYRKGIESLKPEEADAVMRQLKQGTLGTALWLTGWFGYKSFGGLYSKFDPDKKRQGGDLTSDAMSVGGEMIPKPVQHALPLEVIQLAATARRIHDNYSDRKHENQFSSTLKAGLGSIGALAEQIPVLETGVHMAEATNNPYMADKLKQDATRRFEPQILRETGVIKPDKPKPKAGGRF